MSPIEIRIRPNYKWRMALLAAVGIAFLYFYLGYLPTVVWVVGIVTVVVLLFRLVRGESSDPCIVLNEQGVFDRRLKVGIIRWNDIRHISCHSLPGAAYISLDLHNTTAYEERRPLWLRLVSQVQRLQGMSSIAISTNGLDVDVQSLINMIHDGCESAAQRTPERR